MHPLFNRCRQKDLKMPKPQLCSVRCGIIDLGECATSVTSYAEELIANLLSKLW